MSEETKQFGRILRQYRNQARDPESGKALTQQRFIDLLYEKTGIQYTHGAISEWERNKSSIGKDDRNTLVGLVWVLFDCGGIQERIEGDYLLEVGNYRALSVEECEKISPQWAIKLKEDPPQPDENSSPQIILRILFTYIETFLLETETNDTPPPLAPVVIWQDILTPWLKRKGVFAKLLQIVIWIFVAAGIVLLIFPIMYWESTPSFTIIWRYIVGATILPLLIASLTWLYSKQQWQLGNKKSDSNRLLFMMSGALFGFHVSILTIFLVLIFLFALDEINLVEISIIFQLLLAGLFVIPLTIYTSHQMAQLVWNAFHTFLFTYHDAILLGLLLSFATLWGMLTAKFVPYLNLYPLLGIFISFSLVSLSLLWLNKQENRIVISPSILVIFLGVFLLWRVAPQGVWAINGTITAILWLAVSLHTKKFQVTLPGAIFFLCAVILTAVAYFLGGEIFGRIAVFGGIFMWWLFFRKSLRFSWSFLLIIGVWTLGFYLDSAQNWPTELAIAGVTLFSLILIGGEWWQYQHSQ